MINIRPMVAHVSLLLKKKSPEIFLGAGIIGVAVSHVLTYKATLKIDEVNKESDEALKRVQIGREKLELTVYSDEDYKRDLMVVFVQRWMGYAKLYGPAIAVGGISLGLILGSHHILSKRNAAIMAAYKLVDEAFKSYRRKVVAEFGPEKDMHYRFDPEVTEGALEKEEEQCSNPPCMMIGDKSQYAKFFDKSSPYWKTSREYNLFFLKSQERYANDKLNIDGFYFLNDAYDSLGIPRTSAGAIVGWKKGNGDDCISFGILDPVNEVNRDYINGYNEQGFLLDFNVDGIIFDMI